MDSGILADLHKVREAAGEEPWQSRGRGGASTPPETGRPHRQGQRSNDGKPTPNLRPQKLTVTQISLYIL